MWWLMLHIPKMYVQDLEFSSTYVKCLERGQVRF